MNREEYPPTHNTMTGQDVALGYSEAAELLGVAKGTLYAWTSRRRVPHYRVGRRCVRFLKSELVSWMQRHAVPVADEYGQHGVQ
jgi:excisionase family DNA binding protein